MTTDHPDTEPTRVDAPLGRGVQIGSDNTQINYFAARSSPSWPHQVGVVPPRAHCYQARAEVTRLAAAIEGGRTAVLSGLGGVGKTQVAAELARDSLRRGQVDLVVWATVASPEAVIARYAQADTELQGVEDTDSRRAADRFLAWLATTGCRWLVVLDDVVGPAVLSALWPPLTPTGRTVVTSRRRDAALAGDGRQLIEFAPFDPGRAVAYLEARLVGQPDRLRGVEGLCSALGYLPIALAQASAYLLDSPGSGDCAAYRDRITDRRRPLADSMPETGHLPDQHRETVAAIWALSIEHADELRPVGVARPLLEIAALLDPNGIPVEALTAPPISEHLRKAGRPVDAEDITGALHALHRLSLVTVDNAAVVRVHALVQRATRDRTSRARLTTAARAVSDALLAVWPDTENVPSYSQLLRANADALYGCTGDVLLLAGGGGVLDRAASSLAVSGQVSAALAAFEALVAETARVLGPRHLSTFTARHSLAHWRGEAGDPRAAVATADALLADVVPVVGADHLLTLTVRHTLAYWRGESGDYRGAVAATEVLLSDVLRVLGPDHLEALTTRRTLARWRGETGDHEAAVVELNALVTDARRVLGPDHPETLVARRSLAHRRGKAGDPDGAVAALQTLLSDVSPTLGPDHVETLLTRLDLAYWQGEAGESGGALAATETLLADMMRVLGPNHPEVLTARSYLARWRGDVGDVRRATEETEALLADLRRVLGPDHPLTLSTRRVSGRPD